MSARPSPDLLLEALGELRTLQGKVATLCEGQDALREEVREVRALLLRRAPAPDAKASALLRAIHDHVRERPFTTWDLVDHVEVANAEKLGAAILAACGALSPRRVGRLLRSIEGEPLEGLRVVRVGMSRAGILWQLKVDASLQVQNS